MEKGMIECVHCRKLYIPLFADCQKQAMYCSAEIFEEGGRLFMVGAYGSTIVDGETYNVLTNKYKCGIICDACIEDNRHDFTLISSDHYF